MSLENSIKRHIFKELVEHLSEKEISILIGPRQAGKTTLMELLQDYLNKKGEKTMFMSLDFDQDLPFFKSQSYLLEKFLLEIGDSGYVFIDEIQRKENAGLFLKGLYDLKTNYKFIVSGSGSIELKEQINESLMGRKEVFYISTLSFLEFLEFKTNYKYLTKEKEFFKINQQIAENIFNEYLSFGSYPKVVLKETIVTKTKQINEIYQSYLERDITNFLKVEKIESFRLLVKVLASQVGQMINFSELSSTLGISLVTVKNYIYYLEKTFIIHRVNPYFSNLRKEISKSPVFYFHDLGLLNYSLGNFGIKTIHNGYLFENFVFHLLKDSLNLGDTLYFWRTKNKAEVDFVIKSKQSIIPYEVKYKDYKTPIVPKSLHSFIKKYNPENAYIITKNTFFTKQVSNTKVSFLPFYELFK